MYDTGMSVTFRAHIVSHAHDGKINPYGLYKSGGNDGFVRSLLREQFHDNKYLDEFCVRSGLVLGKSKRMYGKIIPDSADYDGYLDPGCLMKKGEVEVYMIQPLDERRGGTYIPGKRYLKPLAVLEEDIMEITHVQVST